MNQGLGQFHRRPSTTAKFYIDDRSAAYIDSAFLLPWLGGQKTQFTNTMLVFGHNAEPEEEQLSKDFTGDVGTNPEEIIMSNWQDSVGTASTE